MWKNHPLLDFIAIVVMFVQLPFTHMLNLGQENPECGTHEMLWGICVEGISQSEFFGGVQQGRLRNGWDWGCQ